MLATKSFVQAGATNRSDYHDVKRPNGCNVPENSKPKQNARSRKRLYSLIAVFVFVGGATCFYIRYSVARPVGRGPAGPAVDRTDFRDVWTGRKIHVVGVGDSITAGLGAAKPSHSYFNRVIENPRDEFADLQGVCLSAVLPNLTYENFAISGSESATHLDVIHESVPTYDDDVFGIVLMTSGGNDLIHMYGRSPPRECAMYGATLQQAKPWIKSYTQRLRTMLEKLDSKFPGGCEIFIANIYDPTDGVGDAPSIFLPDWPDGLAIHSKYNEAIRVVAAKMDNAHVVDLHKTIFRSWLALSTVLARKLLCRGPPLLVFYQR